MQSGADVDGIDFRPFFDMVVGILFILLILIGALLFFQQSAQDENAARGAEHNAQVLDAQITRFLELLGSDLRQRGFGAGVDLANRSVSLPLAVLAKVGPGGLPELSEERAKSLGQALAGDLQCLVSVPQHPETCGAFDRLRLNGASLQVQTGNLPEGAALPQDQFARLLRSEFAANLFRATPALLSLVNSAGAPILEAAGSLSTAPPPDRESLGGEIRIGFEFAPP